MRGASQTLFLAGCLVAAYFLVERPNEIRWAPFAAAVAAAMVGIAGMRRSKPARPAGVGPGRQEPAAEALAAVLAWLGTASRENPDNLAQRLDTEVKPHLREVEDGLGRLHDQLGLERYAQFMDGYARGERALNRAWSAAADGYAREAREQLGVAELALDQARRALDSDAS